MDRNSTGEPGMEGYSRKREEGVHGGAGVKSQGVFRAAWRFGFQRGS